MAINSTSFTNTPQAGDDNYIYDEDYLLTDSDLYNQNTNILTLNVMGNDLGGKAKTLYSIDDGNGNALAPDFQLLAADVTNSVSPWERTDLGNWIRINDGKIEFALGTASDASGPSGISINSLSASDLIEDSFVYAIRLGNGTLSQAHVTVTLQGQNDAATITANSDYEVKEAGGAANGTPGDASASGKLTVHDVDAGQNVFQAVAPASLVGTYGSFTFDSATGQWTYALDQSKADQLTEGQKVTDSLTVTSFDGTASHPITVNIAGSNDAATITASVSEDTAVVEAGGVANAEAGDPSASGTLTVHDVDSGENHFAAVPATSLGGTYGAFTFDSTTGAWTYALDNSKTATQALTAGQPVTDTLTASSLDSTASQTITVNITGSNDAATDIGLSSNSVLENADGAVVGALTTTDVDNGDTHTYTVSDERFEVVNGNLKLKDDESFDFENEPTVTINVTTTDNHNASFDKEFTVSVTDVNEAPTITSGATGSVAENAAASTVVYTATSADVDAGTNGHVTYSLTGADAALLSINAAGEATLNASADFETKGRYDFNVVATDGGNLSDTKAVTVSVTDVNEAPTITSGATGSVAENAPAATVVYTATSADVDAGTNGQVSYSLTGTDAGLLDINAAGQVTLNASADFETKGSYAFNVVATDGGNLSDTKAVTVSVTDVNEAPTTVILSNTVTSTPENGGSIKVADIAVTDDALATNVLSLSGSDALAFTIVGNALWFNGEADYETKASYDVTVAVDDAGVGGASDASQSFSLAITDVNEAPTVSSPYTGPDADPNDFDDLVGVAVASGGFTLVNGTNANDTITPDSGPAGSDTSKNDKDIINGYGGDDTIDAGEATDTVYGGDGDDVIDGGDKVDSLYGQAGSDTIHGDAFGDIIYGGSGDDFLYGDIADDVIYGGSGSDSIYGGDGNDTIIGGYGADTLTGGDGTDTFQFWSVLDTGDVITDFSAGTETLDFSAISGITGISETPSNTVTAYSINYFQQGNDTIVWADTDGITSTVEFQVTLTGVLASALTGDFVL